MPFNLDDYEPVEDRLRAFWTDWPEGRIETDLIHLADGNYIVKALVFKRHFLPSEGQANTHPDATGYAQETEGSSPVNRTSALENCETSAIGRALANLNYAAKKRPSREEMTKTSPAVGVADSGAAGPATTAEQQPRPVGSSGAPAAPGGQAGGTTSTTEGEAVAVEAPGDGLQETQPSPGVTKDAPGPPHYDFAPADCDHNRTTGDRGRLSPRKSPRGPVCPRCGLSYIAVTEGTGKDLGPAA